MGRRKAANDRRPDPRSSETKALSREMAANMIFILLSTSLHLVEWITRPYSRSLKNGIKVAEANQFTE
jgi:hypothetical protein